MGFLSGISSALGIASGVGKIVGGVLGYNRDKHNDAWQKDAYANSLTYRVQDAERNGLDKYAALTGSSQVPSFTGSGLSLTDSAEGFSDFQKVAENRANAKEAEKIQSLEIRSMELDNRTKELENMKLEKELKSVATGPYSGVSPYRDSLPQGSILGSMEVGKDAPVSTSDKLGSNPLDYMITRSLDNAIKHLSLVPKMNGSVGVVPSKDLMDWVSEDLQSRIGFKIDLYNNADKLSAHLAKRFNTPYFWVDYDALGNPSFFFSRNQKDYLDFLNGKTKSFGTKAADFYRNSTYDVSRYYKKFKNNFFGAQR